jgi:MFS family permease
LLSEGFRHFVSSMSAPVASGWSGYECQQAIASLHASLKNITPVCLTKRGIVADYIGRKRTMMLAILAYSLTTALSAAAWNWASFAILRFLVGVGIGSEWVTGASLVSELWPDHARGKGGGLLQSGAGIGSFLASGVWLLIGDLGPNAWCFMYLIGVSDMRGTSSQWTHRWRKGIRTCMGLFLSSGCFGLF